MKYYLTIVALLMMDSLSLAQGTSRQFLVTGKIIDTANALVSFGNVVVYNAVDSSMVTGAVSNAEGVFEVGVKPGSYYLKITFVSYEDKVIPDVSVINRDIDLGTIVLTPSADVLDEVVVAGEKYAMELQLDKRVFNVSKDLSNIGANAADILGNLPSISVDVDGRVSLRGSQNVTIWINGKPSSLTSRDPDALRKLQGNLVESVEVITNPSSRYDAAGEVGIINIILKKNEEKGVNGSFMVNGGYPELYGGSYNINYRNKSINLFSNYGIDYRQSPGIGSSYQEYNSADTSFAYVQNTNRTRGGLSHNFMIGLDYFLNDKNSITSSFVFNPSKGVNESTTEYLDYNENGELANKTIRTEREEEDEENIELALNYKKDFKQAGRKLTADFQWIRSVDNESTDYVQSSDGGETTLQRAINNANESNWLIQSDYLHPFSKDSKIEAGIKSTTRIIKNDYNLEEQDDDGTWIPFDAFTNNMVYTERIHAAYVMASTKIDKLSLQGGLRGELSDIATELTATGQVNLQDYFNLFPSAGLSYEFRKNNTLQLSYSYRISRPDFRELLPFSDFRDPRVYFVGNPTLRPEYTNSYDLGYLLNWNTGSMLASTYYRRRTDVIQRITDPPTDGVAQVVPINMAKENAYGIEFNLSLSIQDWWKINSSSNFYRAITDGTYKDEVLHSDTYTWTNRTTSKMTFFKTLDFQASFNYRGPRITPQGKDLSIYSIDLGLAHDIFGGKGTITAGVRDLLNSRKRRTIIDTQGYYSNAEFQWRARQFTATFTYRLNREKEKQNNRGDGGDDED